MYKNKNTPKSGKALLRLDLAYHFRPLSVPSPQHQLLAQHTQIHFNITSCIPLGIATCYVPWASVPSGSETCP